MKITSIKMLKDVLKLCREQGVSDIEIDNIKLKLNDIPEAKSEQLKSTDTANAQTSDAYTPDQILMWSSAEHYNTQGDA